MGLHANSTLGAAAFGLTRGSWANPDARHSTVPATGPSGPATDELLSWARARRIARAASEGGGER
jgi:hypothetical protein